MWKHTVLKVVSRRVELSRGDSSKMRAGLSYMLGSNTEHKGESKLRSSIHLFALPNELPQVPTHMPSHHVDHILEL